MKIGNTVYNKQSTLKLTAAKPKNLNYDDDILERSKELGGFMIKPDEKGQNLNPSNITGLGDSIISKIDGLY